MAPLAAPDCRLTSWNFAKEDPPGGTPNAERCKACDTVRSSPITAPLPDSRPGHGDPSRTPTRQSTSGRSSSSSAQWYWATSRTSSTSSTPTRSTRCQGSAPSRSQDSCRDPHQSTPMWDSPLRSWATCPWSTGSTVTCPGGTPTKVSVRRWRGRCRQRPSFLRLSSCSSQTARSSPT